MKDYLRWSLRQLYLLYFWPTQFAREVKGVSAEGPRHQLAERAGYMLKMLPWTAPIGIFINMIVGFSCERFAISYGWEESWIGLAFGLVFGVVVGLVFGLAAGVAGGVEFGVIVGAVSGVAGSVARNRSSSVIFSLSSGLVFGAIFGAVSGGAGGIAFSAAFWLA